MRPSASNRAHASLEAAVSDCFEVVADPELWPRHLLVTAWEWVDGKGYQEVPNESVVVDVPAWVREHRAWWMRSDPLRAAVERLEAQNPRGAGPAVREGWLEVVGIQEGTDCEVWVRAGNGRNVGFTVPRHAVDRNLGAVLVTFWEKPPECWVELPRTPDVAGSAVLNVARSQVRLYTY